MQNIGNLTIIALVILNIVVWLVFPPMYDGDPNFLRQYAGEVIGSNNIVLMACSLFLSTRPKWAEKYFGSARSVLARAAGEARSSSGGG